MNSKFYFALKISELCEKNFLVYSYSLRDRTLKGLILKAPLMVEEEKIVNKTFMGFALSFTGMASVQRKPCMVYSKGFSRKTILGLPKG